MVINFLAEVKFPNTAATSCFLTLQPLVGFVPASLHTLSFRLALHDRIASIPIESINLELEPEPITSISYLLSQFSRQIANFIWKLRNDLYH
ncbi:hypothetical protein GcM1_244079 [Golovinomyces cichoracearum]|uniref:Uncharacterized protein n=1 Tax=Golovinomyces cichoracearum TaxID=62708 RepID=A0A420IFY2_9PEZI|nr:hypothetical protein GcM1_244079 [Golovinomyces cichoracearum]